MTSDGGYEAVRNPQPCAACGTADPSCRARGGYCCEACRTADTHVARKPYPSEGAEHVVALHGWNRDTAETQAQSDPEHFAEAHRSEHRPRMSYLHKRPHLHRPDGSLEWGFDA